MVNYDFPLVTVVTASYNNMNQIYRTIKSVCLQNYKLIELLICDDASDGFSSDDIESYINENNNGNIVCFNIRHNASNVGTVKNLNQAYREARGSIIMPLSCGDCFFDKDTVRIIVERFLSTGCKVLATTMIRYKGDFIPKELLPHYDARKILLQMNTSRKQYEAFITSHFHDMIAGCNLYITKKTIEEYNYFDEKYELWEDGPFLSRYLYADKIEYAYDIVSIWYEYGGVSSKPFDYLSPRMRKDVTKYVSSDAIKHIDTFSFIDRRRIRYRYKRIGTGRSKKRYFLYLIYLPELIHYVLYARMKKNLDLNDSEQIEKLLKMGDHRFFE